MIIILPSRFFVCLFVYFKEIVDKLFFPLACISPSSKDFAEVEAL